MISMRITKEEKKFLDNYGNTKALRRALIIYMKKMKELEITEKTN